MDKGSLRNTIVSVLSTAVGYRLNSPDVITFLDDVHHALYPPDTMDMGSLRNTIVSVLITAVGYSL